MPPSPSLRRSPVGGPHNDIHKRGRSFETGLSFKERDDDLALFNELQSRENENFLLQSADDFDDLLSSKVKSFTDLKLGINIPARGESSDLLNADGDKNDYEWLLTPPDTPLFPSLDEDPAPDNHVHIGRARTRPISISRSSTMERSQRSSRGSPSPQRLSPSPKSSSSTLRGRTSSAPHTSPVSLRASPPSRRPSPPPIKPSTPPSRSLTPTSRRTTAGSSDMRGTSPVNTSRGNSASPKIRAWQSNIPGFSLEAPPNLRTSLADRPASYVRGSSPASRASRGRQSRSPTATRSIGSSHSQERDRYSKGSIASSGDDDADSLQSTPLSVSEQRPMPRKGAASGYSSGRPLAYSKKPTKTMSPSSAPKRSFDSAMRQMDRKSPQNMFRPLLSSVPSSTFYAGKASSTHRTMISRNSSVTTSSNASSDLAISGAHDTEDDGASEYARAPFSDIHDEVFAFEKTDNATKEGVRDEGNGALTTEHVEPGNSSFASKAGDEAVAVDVRYNIAKIDSHENVLLCCRCDNQYHPIEVAENDDNICPECKQKEELLSNPKISPSMNVFEESHVTHSTLEAEDQVNQPRESCLENSLTMSVEEESMKMLSEQLITEEHTTVNDPSHTANSLQEMQNCSEKTNRNMNVAEGAGISLLLLNRSSSYKGPLIHGRTINSSAISYDDLSYARDLTSSMRSSIGHGSFSATSSMDLTSGTGRHVVQRQFSGKRSDASPRHHQRTGSSLSGASLPVYQQSTSSRDGSCEGSVTNMRHIVAVDRPGSPSDQIVEITGLHDDAVPSISGVGNNDMHMISRETDLESDHMVSSEFEGKSRGDVELEKDLGNIRNLEETAFVESSMEEENIVPGNRVNHVGDAEDPAECSVSTMSEIEINDSHPSSPKSQIDMVSREDLEDPSSTTHYNDDEVKDSSPKSTESNHAYGNAESTVTMEEQGGGRTKCPTLEEATDTILFCNSIVHDLDCISIKKEKENLEPLEGSRPTVTIPERRSSDHRGFTSNKTPKTQKTRKGRIPETEVKPPPLTENDERSNEHERAVVRNVGLPSSNNADSMKPPKLESKCNCTIM
ncbi:uncharacterized protein [Spinacia oleracea]|uniref:Uncharacterized protein isoform X2 n=1 Tax=Spinacia oleracea TaxID=3562 RepID=A0ABM3QSH1_SPIOL|nr:uncharacterized protein LOC110793968 isoform X2 [Spinacia oleracea]